MKKNYQELIDQYKQIEDTLKLRSQHIMDWIRVGMPVGSAFFGFFSFVGLQDKCPLLLFSGWGVFIIPLIIWRIIAHSIDSQIIQMYPRMLELDRQLRWVTNTTYFFNNLRGQPRRNLERKLGPEEGWLNKNNYREYAQRCGSERRNPYQLLLEIWDEFNHRSCTSRGHVPQDYTVAFLCVMTLAITLILAY